MSREINFILFFVIFLLFGCSKKNFRDYKYIYCCKENSDDKYWGCHNITVDERLDHSDSIKLHNYLDKIAKERLSDTTNFVSRLSFIDDEHSWKSPKFRIKDET
jgi:hypothetical protein